MLFRSFICQMNKERAPKRTDYPLMQAVAERLKTIRHSCGYSQEYVYEQTAINISRLETGKVNISLVSLSILCNLYRVSLEEFFRGISIH